MKVNYKSLILVLVMLAFLILGFTVFSNPGKDEEVFTYGDLQHLFKEDLVYYFEVDGKSNIHVEALQIEGTDPNGDPIYKKKSNGDYDLKKYSLALSHEVQLEWINNFIIEDGNCNNLKDYNFLRPQSTPWYVLYLPYIIVALIFIVMLMFMFKRAGGAGGGKINSFSKSRARVSLNEKDAVKFADVAGAVEEKSELEEIVEFLKDPAKFVKLGARIPRGVLLVGPPGTGKTLLAKAVAGEAGVPFFSISGSDFVEMYVGVGASRVRDLFDNARRTPASIIFIDEIDAVGRHRGAGLGGGHDEREQTLNQLLVEMDGFGTNSGVIVMAATNRPDILDPALTRPGRFDRQIMVNYPDMNDREAILKVHCRNKPLEEGVDLRKIAQTTIGFTGAELANLMNEAALRAAKKDKSLIGMEDIEESYMKLLLGPQKKTRVRSEADNKLCAYHEAGHAVSSYYCKHTDPVKHITIIPAGNTGGVTLSVPTEDRFGMSKNQMLDDIVVTLGGRVAEALVLEDISTGASSDISHATKVIKNMVTRYGMSDKLGTVLYGSAHSSDEVFLGRDFSSGKDFSEKTAAEIDDEVRAIVRSCYVRCESILKEHIDKLHFVANYLLKNEFMDEDQFAAAMSCDDPTIEMIEKIAEDRRRKSEEENRTAKERIDREQELKAERERLAAEALSENRSEGMFDYDEFFAGAFDEGQKKNESNNTSQDVKDSTKEPESKSSKEDNLDSDNK